MVEMVIRELRKQQLGKMKELAEDWQLRRDGRKEKTQPRRKRARTTNQRRRRRAK